MNFEYSAPFAAWLLDHIHGYADVFHLSDRVILQLLADEYDRELHNIETRERLERFDRFCAQAEHLLDIINHS